MKISVLLFLLSIFVVSAENPAPAKLPEGTAQVSLVLYDYLVDGNQSLIEVDGKMHPGLFPSYTKILTTPQINRLLKALTQDHGRSQQYACSFAPHHGIVFRSAEGRILGSVSICFRCQDLHSETFPKTGNPFYSYWGWPELRKIFTNAGLPILRSNKAYSALGNSKKEDTPLELVADPEPESGVEILETKSEECSR